MLKLFCLIRMIENMHASITCKDLLALQFLFARFCNDDRNASKSCHLKLRFFTFFAMILSCTHGTALAILERAKIGFAQNTEDVDKESD